MTAAFGLSTPAEAKVVGLLGDMLTTLGGSTSFGAKTPPIAKMVALLTGIRDRLTGQSIPGDSACDLFGAGVTGITFLFRPRGEPRDPEEMNAYIVHGDHVVSFVRNGTHDYAPSVSGPIYEIQLDRAYEPDEVAVLVWPGSWEHVDEQLIAQANPTGALSGSGGSEGFGGLVHAPSVWQTGPAGDKSKRLVIPVTLRLEPGGAVTWSGGHSDPLCIMLVFFDRSAADVRVPPLPTQPSLPAVP